MNKKQLFTLSVTLLLGVGLASCGGGSTSEPTSSNTPISEISSPNVSEEPTSEGPVSEGPTSETPPEVETMPIYY